MNEVSTLVWELEAAGAELAVVDGQLSIDAPTGTLTPDRLACVKEHKPAMIELLQARDAGQAEREAAERQGNLAVSRIPRERPAWWSRRLTDAENRAVDEFMDYGPGGPDAEPDWEKGLVDVEPCETCNSLVLWWNAFGDKRCMRCDPPLQAIRLLRRREAA